MTGDVDLLVVPSHCLILQQVQFKWLKFQGDMFVIFFSLHMHQLPIVL
jgi:hypothetical protein